MFAKILDIPGLRLKSSDHTPMINRRRVANLELGVVTPNVEAALAQAFDQVEQKLREIVAAHAVEFKGVLWQQVCFIHDTDICPKEETIIYNQPNLIKKYYFLIKFLLIYFIFY
jgi:hypothetical protein